MFEETQIKVNISENLYFPLADAFGEIINSARLQRSLPEPMFTVQTWIFDKEKKQKSRIFRGFRLKPLYHPEVSQSAYLGYLIIFSVLKLASL